MRRTFTILGAALLLAGLARGACAQTDQPIVVPLSDPARPAALEVSLVFGSVSVRGYDGDEVVITPQGSRRLARLEEDEDADRAGLRRIPNTSMALTAEEEDNTVTITTDWPRNEMRLDIAVPRRTSVRARTVNNGELTVEGVSGEHELSNVNGGISAIDVTGSVVVNTTNGDVEVSFTELTPDKAMAFTSFNGEIDVTFPPGLAADLLISTGRGDVFTDFDVEARPREPVVERSTDGGRHRVSVDREMRLAVGGGGPEMRFKTFNGDIVIRRR